MALYMFSIIYKCTQQKERSYSPATTNMKCAAAVAIFSKQHCRHFGKGLRGEWRVGKGQRATGGGVGSRTIDGILTVVIRHSFGPGSP